LRHDQKHKVYLLIFSLFLVSTASLFCLPNPSMFPSYRVSPLRSCGRRFPSPDRTFWRRIYRRKKVERINLHIISLNQCEWWTEKTVTLLSEISAWNGTGYNSVSWWPKIYDTYMWVYLIMRYAVQKWLNLPTTHMKSSYNTPSLLPKIKIWLSKTEVYYTRVLDNKRNGRHLEPWDTRVRLIFKAHVLFMTGFLPTRR